MKPEIVIFDVGNVLIEWNPERFYDAAIGPEKRRALFSSVDLDSMNLAVDRGAPFKETIYATADAHPDWHDEIRMWHDRWIEMASPVISHSVRLMRALRERGVPVFSLTNFGIQSYDFAATHYSFLREFDRDYISGHMKVLKPEVEIYKMLEADCGVDPRALMFTDDRPENIAMAAARGWQTHLFDGPQGWADRLVAEELLSREQAN